MRGGIVTTKFISGSCDGESGVIRWKNKSARFMIEDKKGNFSGITNMESIIGNIYENPELIK